VTPVTISLATLYHGDCLGYGLHQCDTVITDPVWPNCPPGLLAGADGRQDKLLKKALSRIDCRTVVIILGFDSDPRFLSAVPTHLPYIRSQQLPYAMPGYRGRLLGGDEIAYIFGEIPKGNGVIPGRLRTETRPKAQRSTGHPCPRSDTHLEQLVRYWSRDGETVLDPFMGTGSTGVAATSSGRQFTGFEIDGKFFDIAVSRITQAQSQQLLNV